MRGRPSRSSTRWLLVRVLALSAMLAADAAFAQHYAVGDAIEPFTREDQHGESRTVDSMLLDRDGETTIRLPDAEGQATLLFLDGLSVQRIVHVAEAPAVRRELESAPGGE